ncbi:hypothetical protein [Salimicrobium flavidum]|uniref:Uncharacterized protein n=1 Tax=Salimicrobium flavidum TaxID=570947 RepID=A0A1N7IKF2_9BACI|nr:hypothetical protein [Salimicrobium flavidum]SIS37569.1 hypothetical protein SAMN05421687_101384 [Salimicrobium flavidum]
MIGSIRWNIWISMLVALTAFLLSWRVNPLLTSLLRSGIAFIILFITVFLIRAIVTKVSTPETNESVAEDEIERTQAQEHSDAGEDEDGEETSRIIKELMNQDKGTN